jgi:L-lactate dehydrogenase complex protein LldG
MSARDVVLGRLRAALDGAAKPEDVPREYRSGGDLPAGDPGLIDLLADRLTDYRAVVHRAPAGAAHVAAAVAEILVAASAARPRVLVPPGLPADWLPAEVDVLRDDGLDADTLAAVDGVVTGAAVAVAETGTIVLDASSDQGRRIITLLPDLHICVLRPAQVVASVPEAIARISPGRPLTWISGPSATSDIELNRVEGVHGPRRLHVIIWEAPA